MVSTPGSIKRTGYGPLTVVPKAVGVQTSELIAINQKGDILITDWSPSGSIGSYLYSASTGRAVDLTGLPGGTGFIAAALNDKDQAVGNGSMYSNGTLQTLASLLPVSTGWSNLNATGINDSGQIVGQGTYDGQQLAFLMTPDAETPEPATLLIGG